MSDVVPDHRIRTGKAGFRRLLFLTVALALLFGTSFVSQSANPPPGTKPSETRPSLWESHRNQVIAASVGFAALASIAVLLLVRSRAQRRAERLLASRLQFERLLSELSASVIDVPPDRIDLEVSRALGKVLEAMDLDRCSLFVVLPGNEGIRVTHRAEMPGIPSLEGINCNKSAIFVDALCLGKTIALEDVAHDLAAPSGERIQALDLGVKSLLLIPVSTSDGVVRAVSFQTTRRLQSWPSDLVSRLRLIGQILFSAVTGKRAEAALRASEERYREVVDTQTDLICRYLPDTTLTFVNEAYCRYFGRPREELIGRRFLDLIPEGARELARRHVQSLIENPRVAADEHEVIRSDGSTGWQQWIDYAVYGRDGRIIEFQAIGRDVTDRKHAEEADRKLASATRLTVLGELAASIAHEINQPLGAILSNTEAAEMLLDSGDGHVAEIRGILADIHRDDLRASQVIQRVRSLLQNRPSNFQPLDVNDLAQEIARFVAPDARRRQIALELDLADSLPAVRGDAIELQQLLLNLAVNGMEAMTGIPEHLRRLTIRTRPNGGRMLEVEVSDNGHGIPADVLPRLFQSFVTTRKNGLGLGLSLSRSIVESHGGTIRAENNPDRGATFRVYLPTDEGTPAGIAAAAFGAVS
jgi:PAS domain S-box-containing protein